MGLSWGEASCNCLRMKSPFRYFKTSPEIIRLAVMMWVLFPLSLRNVEDLLHERGIKVSHETGPVLVEPFWPDRCRRDPQEADRPNACVVGLSVAP